MAQHIPSQPGLRAGFVGGQKIMDGAFFSIILFCLGCIASVAGGVVVAVLVAALTRGVSKGRKKAIITGALLPILCLFWVAIILAVGTSMHDTEFCSLPNGYSIRTIDDNNLLLNLKTQNGGRYGTADSWDTIDSVTLLQVAGPYLLGVGSGMHGAGPYFLLDARTGRYKTFSDKAALQAAAKPLDIPLDLQSIGAAPCLTDWIFLAILALAFLPPFLLGLLFWVGIWRLRKTRIPVPV